MLHGGVRRTPYGVIVASEPLVMQVLGDDRRFSVSEYRKRMDASIGQIYLGLDAGDDYQRLSTAANAAIEKISALDAFNAAWGETTAALMGLVGHQKVPASFSLEQLADETLARLSKYWLDIPDGRFVISGGRPLPGDAAPRCPFHSLPPSRYIFSSPQPRLAVAAMGTKSGNLLLKGVKEFVEAHRDKHERAQLKGELSIALFKAMGEDRDELARNLVGVLEGFLPTVFGNFLKVTNLWTSDELQTLWRLQQELCAKADADYHHARSVLERPLHEAMMKRPIPDILYRTATKEVLLGDLRVRAGERVVLSIAAATQEMLGGGKISVAPVFGGLRSQAVHPTHACPGYEMAMGVMLGMLAALLQAGTLAPGAHPFMNLGDPKPFFVKRPKEAVAVP
jgi:hypothetical protein